MIEQSELGVQVVPTEFLADARLIMVLGDFKSYAISATWLISNQHIKFPEYSTF